MPLECFSASAANLQGSDKNVRRRLILNPAAKLGAKLKHPVLRFIVEREVPFFH